MALKSPQWSQITFSWFHTVRWGNLQQNDISHALSYSQKPKLTAVVRIWPRASPFDLLSRFVRDFDIRQMSSYDFSDSSHHSASNDMRQAHVLTHSSGVRLPIQYLMKTPPLTSRHEKVTRISALRLGKYSSVGAIETKSTLKPN